MNKLKSEETSEHQDFSAAVAKILSELWDRCPRTVGVSSTKYEKMIDDVIQWIHLLRHKDLDCETSASLLYDRCRSDEPLLNQSGLFAEGRSTVIARLKRTLAGIAQLIEKRLPMDLRRKDDITFKVTWRDGGAEGEWQNASVVKKYLLADIVLKAAQMFGEFSPVDGRVIVGKILTDLQAGVLLIPNFIRDEISDTATTVLHWEKPGLSLGTEQARTLSDLDFEYSMLLPNEKELKLWKDHPEMAQVWDEVVCGGVMSGFHSERDI